MKYITLSQKLLRRWIVKLKSHRNQRNANIWVFGEWFGDKCIDNSMYFANYAANKNQCLDIYWICNSDTDTSMLDKRIKVIMRDSETAIKILSQCGAAILSQSFEDFSTGGLNYADGAVVVHLWHGIPWKKIGHDSSQNKSLLTSLYAKVLDYLDSVTYYASPSDHYDNVLLSAFGAKPTQIIHAGYPRNSIFYDVDEIARGRERIIKQIKKYLPEYDFRNCKFVSYMPTFRNDPNASRSLEKICGQGPLNDYLVANNIVIIQKSHFVNQTRDGFNQNKGNKHFIELNNVGAQDLLCASDLLITDYSGAFFDYLLLDRPIIHYLYDYDYYCTQDRGLYYTKEDVTAGEIAEDESQLIDAIVRNLDNPSLYQQRRRHIRNEYVKYDTKDSCELIYKKIIEELKRRNLK